jgi:hypothetical protein
MEVFRTHEKQITYMIIVPQPEYPCWPKVSKMREEHSVFRMHFILKNGASEKT